jgi:hypothetical protein
LLLEEANLLPIQTQLVPKVNWRSYSANMQGQHNDFSLTSGSST